MGITVFKLATDHHAVRTGQRALAMEGKITELPFILVAFLIPVTAFHQFTILETAFIVLSRLGDPEPLAMGSKIMKLPLI